MKQIFLFIALVCSTTCVFGQSTFADRPIFKVSLFTHSIGKPIQDYIKKPLNIGISIGTQFAYKKGKQNPLLQEFEISWYRHKHLNKALMIRTNISKNYFRKSGFFVAPELGFGYIMDISDTASYTLNDSGSYERFSGITHGFITGIALTTGKRFDKEGSNSFAPFIKYEGLVQFPYSDFTPLLPHTMLHLGSKIFLTDNN